jgi:hypothetical protein
MTPSEFQAMVKLPAVLVMSDPKSMAAINSSADEAPPRFLYRIAYRAVIVLDDQTTSSASKTPSLSVLSAVTALFASACPPAV